MKTITDLDRTRLREMAQSLRRAGREYEGFAGEMERVLSTAQVFPATEVDPNVVTLNSRVQYRDLETDRVETITVIDRPNEIESISSVFVLAPLGAALLGARVGDVVEWRFRRGSALLLVEAVPYQPEAAGEFHL